MRQSSVRHRHRGSIIVALTLLCATFAVVASGCEVTQPGWPDCREHSTCDGGAPSNPDGIDEALFESFEQLYVDIGAQGASDANAGTRDSPLASVSEGLRRAHDNRRAGLPTRVRIFPGTYREGIVGDFSSSGPLIVLQAVEPGGVIISGSEPWGDWTCTEGLCAAPWPHTWGVAANPWPGIPFGPLGLRREMVFVDGEPLSQVLSLDATRTTPASFFVDEGTQQLHVNPPLGADMDGALVEVAFRERLLQTRGLNDVIVQGITFQHAATRVSEAALYVTNQRNVTFDDVTVHHNSWDGLGLNGDHITVTRSRFNHNGGSGLGAFRSVSVRIVDSETSFNSWRGHAGGFTDWAIGNKFMLVRDLVIIGHRSIGNLSRGLWLDNDVEDVRIERATLCGNLRDGLFVEAVQGPVAIRDSLICDNGHAGILTSLTHNLVVQGNALVNNGVAQLLISGETQRAFPDFVTDEWITLGNEAWSWWSNRLEATGRQLLVSTTLPSSLWEGLMTTSEFGGNEYVAGQADVFRLPGGRTVDFREWQRHSSQDTTSVFRVTTAAQ